jgi:hypothetical protein
VLASVAGELVRRRAWEPLGFVRLRDYGVERVGLSARSLQDLARVDGRLSELPTLEQSLLSGALPWTKVRLVARVAEPQDEARWVAYALHVTADTLSREVRAVDVGSVEAGAASDDPEDPDGDRREIVQVRCAPVVNAMWFRARQLARRVSGEQLPTWECMELVAAEVLSAVPLDASPDEAEGSGGDAAPTHALRLGGLAGITAAAQGGGSAAQAGSSEPAIAPAPPAADPCAAHGFPKAGPIPERMQPMLDGLAEADPHALDARLRSAVAMEQRLDAEIGRLLRIVSVRQLHRASGIATLEHYARERLGMSPRKARALLRLERAGARCLALRHAYRSGALSWVRAQALVPLVLAGGAGRWGAEWVAWAQRVSVRRLEDDVDRALVLRDTDPDAWEETGGLPERVREPHGSAADPGARLRQIRARSTASGETSLIFFNAPADVARLFRAVLRTVQRRLERRSRLQGTQLPCPTRGEALEAMLGHCLDEWARGESGARRRHRIFERDGWRCTAPGCSSFRNLQDHHIVFRSAGGGDDPSNRTTLCAWHHLRGVHAGVLRCSGQAPGRLRFDLGVGGGRAALASFASGDVLVSPRDAAACLL